jgi:hypothetical protein
MNAESEIKSNKETYDFIVACAEYYLKESKVENALFFCQRAATFATFNYCGFYSEIKLENILLSVGKNYINSASTNLIQRIPVKSGKQVLHYATSIHNVGGHTRLIENWIKNDSSNKHDVVLTMQKDAIPDFVTDALNLVGGQVITINNELTIAKANEVYNLSKNYDVVVLHHHANDIIPVIAFSSDANTPVCILNHGDHRYWLGVVICDILIEIRDNLIESDRVRRKINNFSLLPIPIKYNVSNANRYSEARLKLGIKEDEIMLLSIGASYKYMPIDGRSFFEDISSIIVDKHVKLYIVGISPNEELASNYSNIFFVAPTPELDDYRNACDIYIEGYPFSSFTAHLEVAAMSKPIHRMYNPPLLNEYRLIEYPNKIYFPNSKEEWLHRLSELINNREERLKCGVQDRANSNMHGIDKWKEYLDSFYNKANKLNHCVKQMQEDNTLFLSVNDIYLHKMQKTYKMDMILSDFFGISALLKIRMLMLGSLNKLCSEKLRLRDILWFVFKSKKQI